MSSTNSHEMQDGYFYKQVVRIGLPIAMSQLLSSLLAFIDIIMVSNLGDIAVGAVGIAASFSFLNIMVNFGFVSGLAIYFSQYWGSKDFKNIHKVFIVTIFSSMIITSIFFILGFFFSDTVISWFNNSGDTVNAAILQDYGVRYIKIASFSYFTLAAGFVISMLMRSVEKVIFPQVVAIIMVALNTILNYLLIQGRFGFPRLEIEGAALATVISSSVGALILISFMIFTKREVFKIKFGLIKEITKDYLKKLIKKALPVAINETIWGLGMSFYLIAFSYISVEAISSVHISNQVMGFFWTINAGISSACAIMLGKKLGEGKIDVAKNWGIRFIKLTFFAGLILGIILFFLSSKIPLMFSSLENGIKENLRLILVVFSFYVPIKFVNAIHIIGTLRSGGDTMYAMLSEAIPLWLIGVPLAFILSIYTTLPLYIIVAIVNIEEIIKFVITNYRFLTFKWLKNLTEE